MTTEKQRLTADVNRRRQQVIALTQRLRLPGLSASERTGLREARAKHGSLIRQAEDRLAEIERERRASDA